MLDIGTNTLTLETVAYYNRFPIIIDGPPLIREPHVNGIRHNNRGLRVISTVVDVHGKPIPEHTFISKVWVVDKDTISEAPININNIRLVPHKLIKNSIFDSEQWPVNSYITVIVEMYDLRRDKKHYLSNICVLIEEFH